MTKRDDDDGILPYRKPTVSAWVAVAAVAFSVFTLGGFIKTYRQLETLREESRREIGELRELVESLRLGGRTAAQTSRTRRRSDPAAAAVPEPPGRRRAAAENRAAAAPRLDPAAVMAEAESLCLDDDAVDRTRVTYTFGRSSAQPPETLALAGDFKSPAPAFRGEVAAVNNGERRLMVEGGRDAGLELGARLELSRQGRWIGDLRVVDVFDTMSACEVLHSTQQPEPGDTVRMP